MLRTSRFAVIDAAMPLMQRQIRFACVCTGLVSMQAMDSNHVSYIHIDIPPQKVFCSS